MWFGLVSVKSENRRGVGEKYLDLEFILISDKTTSLVEKSHMEKL